MQLKCYGETQNIFRELNYTDWIELEWENFLLDKRVPNEIFHRKFTRAKICGAKNLIWGTKTTGGPVAVARICCQKKSYLWIL